MTTNLSPFDPQEAVAPLLAAQPGSQVVATCWLCGQRIDGIACLDARVFLIHPDECPEARPPAGMLL